MGKKKRKPRKSKKNLEEEATYSQSDVKKLETVTEEEPVEVLQPFTDPTQIEEITTLEEVPTVDGDAIISAIAELPEPILTPTQRQYMTEFYPTYSGVRSKLRRLAGL